jgi:hypothetical protein
MWPHKEPKLVSVCSGLGEVLLEQNLWSSRVEGGVTEATIRINSIPTRGHQATRMSLGSLSTEEGGVLSP